MDRALLFSTNVPGCIGSNAKTLGLQYLQFPDMGACGGPPYGARIVHHRTDELLIEQNTIPDGDRFSFSGEVLVFPVSEPLSFSPDRYVSTM